MLRSGCGEQKESCVSHNVTSLIRCHGPPLARRGSILPSARSACISVTPLAESLFCLFPSACHRLSPIHSASGCAAVGSLAQVECAAVRFNRPFRSSARRLAAVFDVDLDESVLPIAWAWLAHVSAFQCTAQRAPAAARVWNEPDQPARPRHSAAARAALRVSPPFLCGPLGRWRLGEAPQRAAATAGAAGRSEAVAPSPTANLFLSALWTHTRSHAHG